MRQLASGKLKCRRHASHSKRSKDMPGWADRRLKRHVRSTSSLRFSSTSAATRRSSHRYNVTRLTHTPRCANACSNSVCVSASSGCSNKSASIAAADGLYRTPARARRSFAGVTMRFDRLAIIKILIGRLIARALLIHKRLIKIRYPEISYAPSNNFLNH